jgi:hypothetical protein
VNSPARILVPPRPNPGPEPLPAPSFNAYWLVALIGALLAVGVVWFALSKRRARLARSGSESHPSGDSATTAAPTPAEQMLGLAGLVRKDLIDRLGPVWRARTTEELSVSPELVEALGSDQLAELVDFLDQVDLLKFAPARLPATDSGSPDSEVERWRPVIDGLRTKLSAYKSKTPSPKAEGSNGSRAARGKAQGRTVSEAPRGSS